MDQLIKDAKNFRDLTDTFSIWEALVAMALSFILSMIIALVYRRTHKGVSYSSTFVQTLVIMAVVVSVVMMIIGSNIARAFSLVGALSIIRFRTAIKDSRDVAFVFLVMAIGMACGTRFYLLAVVFTAVLTAILLTLHLLRVGEQRSHEQLLRVSVDKKVDFATQFQTLFQKFLKSHRVVEVTTTPDGTRNSVAWVVQFSPSVSTHAFLNEVRELAQDENVQLLAGEDHVTI